ncbi:hypothetical protein NADFUDRAFT_66549 [Nadsonia fulvescens var. elongata DSM 6958]|uniref:Uncharacterized protein n=1 Tax=Nadsonia fulvescens var. elongata DSM 6958 TaxID=857566 RepID=A0A1E3PJ60_9ASCO|nr:hypothetical protein NADFUDRAFT_66549 [Nadsonia fulvescens var. elongata DSM 6958]
MYRRNTRFSQPPYTRAAKEDTQDQPLEQERPKYSESVANNVDSSRFDPRLVNLKPREGFELRPFYKSLFNPPTDSTVDNVQNHVQNRYPRFRTSAGVRDTTSSLANLDKKPEYTPYKSIINDNDYRNTVTEEKHNKLGNQSYYQSYNTNIRPKTSLIHRNESGLQHDVRPAAYDTNVANDERSTSSIPIRHNSDYLRERPQYSTDRANLLRLIPDDHFEKRRPMSTHDTLPNRRPLFPYSNTNDNERPARYTSEPNGVYHSPTKKFLNGTISCNQDDFGDEQIDYGAFYKDRLNRAGNAWDNKNYQTNANAEETINDYNRPFKWRSTPATSNVTNTDKHRSGLADLGAILSENRPRGVSFSSPLHQNRPAHSPVNAPLQLHSSATKPIETLINRLQQQDETLTTEGAQRIVFESLQIDYATLRNTIKDLDTQISTQEKVYSKIIDVLNIGDGGSTWRPHSIWANVKTQLKVQAYDFLMTVMVPAVFSLIICCILYIIFKIFTFIWYWDPN